MLSFLLTSCLTVWHNNNLMPKKCPFCKADENWPPREMGLLKLWHCCKSFPAMTLGWTATISMGIRSFKAFLSTDDGGQAWWQNAFVHRQCLDLNNAFTFSWHFFWWGHWLSCVHANTIFAHAVGVIVFRVRFSTSWHQCRNSPACAEMFLTRSQVSPKGPNGIETFRGKKLALRLCNNHAPSQVFQKLASSTQVFMGTKQVFKGTTQVFLIVVFPEQPFSQVLKNCADLPWEKSCASFPEACLHRNFR